MPDPSVLKTTVKRSPTVKRCPKCRKRRLLTRGYCKPCNKAYYDDYYRKNKAKLIARSEARRKANPEVIRAAKRLHRQRLKLEVIAAYGGACKCCGETTVEFLSIDHIGGGGLKHRAEVTGHARGAKFYHWLKRNGFPKKGLRLLCHNCNQSIGLYGYCPHHAPSRFTAPTEALSPRQCKSSGA